MSKRTFDKIMVGLDNARACLDGAADKRFRVHVPEKIDVKKIRTRVLAFRRKALQRLTALRLRGAGLGARPPPAGPQRAHPAEDRGKRAGSRFARIGAMAAAHQRQV